MVKNRINSFRYAFKGIATLVSTQPNARIHLAATVCVVAAGLLCEVARIEWAILSLAIGLVWAAEALNTALEFLADKASPERHELVEKAKDTAAAGVLIAAIAAFVIGLVIFLPYIL